MAGIRLTGLASGMDTESLVQQLSEAYQMKVDNVKKDQTKLEWKKEAWKGLNTKIMDFYKGSLSMFKSVSTYRTKSATGDFSGVKITAGNTAVNGTHRVQVKSTAIAQMWTGRKLNNGTYTATSYAATSNTDLKLSDLKDGSGNVIGDDILNAKFKVTGTDGEEVTISANQGADGATLTESSSIADVVAGMNKQFEDAGIGAKVEFVGGNFRITNSSAQATTDADGVVTGYENGVDYQLSFVDSAMDPNGDASTAAASIFGVKETGTTLKAQTMDDLATSAVGGTKFHETVETEGKSVTGSTKLVDLGIAKGAEIKINGNAITIDENTTLSSLAAQMNKLGIEANYDAGQGRFYLNAKGTGTANKFTLEGSDADALAKLGLDLEKEVDADGDGKMDSVEGRIDASDAIIEYNGVEYTQSTSTFNINGLTIEAVEEGDMQTFTVGTDAQGIYDKVKKFVNDYNTLIEEMNTLYNAERVTDYEPLTDDEKAAMSEDEIEKWEGVIKASLLRRDDTISSLLSSMRSTLNKSVSVTMADGSTKSFALSSFGINTGIYSEKGKLHIYGNADDADYADYDDALMKAINENPEAVEKTLSTLGSEMYNNLMKAMGKRELSSALTFYNDIQIDNEIDDYKEKVSTLQEKAIAEEDKYYEQFAAMETALAKLQSQQTYISQLFGG